MVMFSQQIDPQFRELVWKKVSEKLSDEKKTTFLAYQEDKTKTAQLYDHVSQLSVVGFLDGHLCLTTEQNEQLKN